MVVGLRAMPAFEKQTILTHIIRFRRRIPGSNRLPFQTRQLPQEYYKVSLLLSLYEFSPLFPSILNNMFRKMNTCRLDLPGERIIGKHRFP